MAITWNAMKPLPTLRQLGYLVAVVDQCHFGRAAEACAVTQSTLSAGIRELEEVLGEDVSMKEAFKAADDVLHNAVAGIAYP